MTKPHPQSISTTVCSCTYEQDLFFLYCSRFNENPIHCDCHLAWMAEWLRARPSAGLYTQCVEPTALRGMEIKHLERSEFVCNGM